MPSADGKIRGISVPSVPWHEKTAQRIRIGQTRQGPDGACRIMRIEGDAVKVRESDGIAVWDKPTVLTWPVVTRERRREEIEESREAFLRGEPPGAIVTYDLSALEQPAPKPRGKP